MQRQGIDTRRQLAANQQAIDLANVEIQAAGARCAVARIRGSSLISERDYEKSRDDAAAARVNHKHAIETAQLQKESLQFELRARRLERDRRLVVQDLERRVGELSLKSPVNGIVGTLAVAERASVAQNAPLITVVDLTAFEIEFQVPESYADDLGLGMDASELRNEEVRGESQRRIARSAVRPGDWPSALLGRGAAGLRQNQRLSTRIVLEIARRAESAAWCVPRLGGGRVAYVVQDDVAVRANRSAPARSACPRSRSSTVSRPAIASSFQTLASSSASKPCGWPTNQSGGPRQRLRDFSRRSHAHAQHQQGLSRGSHRRTRCATSRLEVSKASSSR